jgi:hypothetical protein
VHRHGVSALIDSLRRLRKAARLKDFGPKLPQPLDAATKPEDVQILKGKRRQPARAIPPPKTNPFFAPRGFLPGTTGLMPGLEFSTRMVR